jgi:hypothetical protein
MFTVPDYERTMLNVFDGFRIASMRNGMPSATVCGARALIALEQEIPACQPGSLYALNGAFSWQKLPVTIGDDIVEKTMGITMAGYGQFNPSAYGCIPEDTAYLFGVTPKHFYVISIVSEA